MGVSALEVVQQFQQRIELLERWEEHLAEREYAICVDAHEPADVLTVPLCLRHANTDIAEIFTPNWSDPAALSVVVTRLNDLCAYWENVYAAHRAAQRRFVDAKDRGRRYCLYLRSFSSVSTTVLDEPAGRAVAYFNTVNLDRNVAMALSEAERALAPVTCQHPDDMALLEGRWRLPAFRVHDHTWKEVVRGAINSAQCIVFYLDESTPGASFELAAIRQRGLMSRTVLVHTPRAALPEDSGDFAATFKVADFISLSRDLMHAKLRPAAYRRLESLMTDAFEPDSVDDGLLSMPCNLVDPRIPERFAGRFDPRNTFFVTPSNVTAFGWFVGGLPDALLQWNAISRRLFEEKRGPTIAAMNELLGSLFRAQTGAASLGLTASLSGLIGLRANVASLVVVPDPDARQARAASLMQVLDIANRFDALTSRHDWRDHNDDWKEAILEGRYT